ncbi:MAG: acetyl-CoA carboxylase carboxyltransferase subunit alpha [Polyangiales bacterium]
MAHLDFEAPLIELQERIDALESKFDANDEEARAQLHALKAQASRVREELSKELTVWQKVQLSRHPDRPHFLDFADRIFDDFLELHGDRCFADDPAIISGFATIGGQHVAIIAHQKGRTAKEKSHRNFAMARPEGYRKAMRIMRLAERYRRPLLTFIDTPGAYPGIGAEERGQSEAIGACMLTMSELTIPVIATVIGEGGSGGALALGVGNRVLMLQYATYSVITPEGCASILWRDPSLAAQAATALAPVAKMALELGVIDRIVDEPIGGAHVDPDLAARTLKSALREELHSLSAPHFGPFREQRMAKFRRMGRFIAS